MVLQRHLHLEIVALIVGALLCPILLQKFNKRNLSLAGCIVVVIAMHSLW